MSIPPLLAVPARRVAGRLERIRGRGLAALLTAAVLGLVLFVGAILPEGSLPLTWYAPALDSATAVILLVVLTLSSIDVVLRRHSRLLAAAAASLALALVWLGHMLAFPGVLPAGVPLIQSQTAPYLFNLGHIAMPLLLGWILMQRTRALEHPRRTLARVIALTVLASLVPIAMAAAAAWLLPPLNLGGRFTELSTVLQAVPFLALATVGAVYRRGRYPERRIETAVITALVLVSVESFTFMFMRLRYDGFWYVGHGLRVLPYAALLAGAMGGFTAARREAEGQLRGMEKIKESQQRLQGTIDTPPSAVITADHQGLITGWNRKAEAIFGRSHDPAGRRTLARTT